MTPRFEVDYKQRLKQSREASNAVRLPRLGYELYRVYDIEEKKDEQLLKNTYSKYKGGNTVFNNTRQYNSGYWQQILWAFIDEVESRTEPAYDVRWLKAKQVTLLQIKGHRVEPAEPGEKPGQVNLLPVRLGR